MGTDGIGKHIRRIAVLLLLAVTAPRPLAQGPEPGQQRLVGTPVTGVLVDVIVRDQQGAVVTDLDAAGVEVLEDGVPQTITLFEPPRERRAPASVDPGKPAAPPLSEAIPVPRLVALVFHELGPEA